MQLKDLKNVSKLIDKKLAKRAKDQKRLEEQEQEELDQHDHEFINADDHTDEHTNAHANVTKKVLLCGAVVALGFGLFKHYNNTKVIHG